MGKLRSDMNFQVQGRCGECYSWATLLTLNAGEKIKRMEKAKVVCNSCGAESVGVLAVLNPTPTAAEPATE